MIVPSVVLSEALASVRMGVTRRRMMTKPWESLLKPVKIVISPQPGRDMTASMDIDYEYNDSCSLQHKSVQVNNDHIAVEYSYPDMFKKLVAACDDVYEAWELYQRLQEPVPVNWKDFM